VDLLSIYYAFSFIKCTGIGARGRRTRDVCLPLSKVGRGGKTMFYFPLLGENIYKQLKFEYEGGKCAVKHEM
jgi:hypothetical protein